jgi:hypothetical protein
MKSQPGNYDDEYAKRHKLYSAVLSNVRANVLCYRNRDLVCFRRTIRKQRQVKGCCKIGIYSRWSSHNGFVYHITLYDLVISNTKCVICSTQNTQILGTNFNSSSSSLAFTIVTYLPILNVNYDVMNLPYFSEVRLAHHMAEDRTDTTQKMWPAVHGNEIRTRDSSIRGSKGWWHLRPRYYYYFIGWQQAFLKSATPFLHQTFLQLNNVIWKCPAIYQRRNYVCLGAGNVTSLILYHGRQTAQITSTELSAVCCLPACLTARGSSYGIVLKHSASAAAAAKRI